MKNKTKIGVALLQLAGLAWFGLLPKAQAVVPPPDGGYPNFTTAEGTNALKNLATGAGNTAVGWYSLFSDTTGGFNTAVGAGTLLFNDADSNTAVGAAALLLNTTGNANTAVGTTALLNNTVGYSNTAIGSAALFSNTEGRLNTAVGEGALLDNSTGQLNTAIAARALNHNTTGENNTAVGYAALLGNTTGDTNTAVGSFALNSNDSGNGNSAFGLSALERNTTGNFNTAIGIDALSNSMTGNYNTGVGLGAGISVTTASNVLCLNNVGSNVSDTTWIGGVYGVSTQSGFTAPVIVSDHGQLGTLASSQRFKKDIMTMDHASEAVLSLRPVTFHYKTDAKGTPQFGLIAEEVAKVNPTLVLPDKEGKPYTVRYEAVNAMLLNEFLKEHKKVEQLESTVATLAATVKEQAVEIQKVSAQLRIGGSTPQIVANNPKNKKD